LLFGGGVPNCGAFFLLPSTALNFVLCPFAAGAAQHLLTVKRVVLHNLRDAFVACGNPQHDCVRFTGFHFVSYGAYFFGAEPPKFWIVQFVWGVDIAPSSAVIIAAQFLLPDDNGGVYVSDLALPAGLAQTGKCQRGK